MAAIAAASPREQILASRERACKASVITLMFNTQALSASQRFDCAFILKNVRLYDPKIDLDSVIEAVRILVKQLGIAEAECHAQDDLGSYITSHIEEELKSGSADEILMRYAARLPIRIGTAEQISRWIRAFPKRFVASMQEIEEIYPEHMPTIMQAVLLCRIDESLFPSFMWDLIALARASQHQALYITLLGYMTHTEKSEAFPFSKDLFLTSDEGKLYLWMQNFPDLVALYWDEMSACLAEKSLSIGRILKNHSHFPTFERTLHNLHRMALYYRNEPLALSFLAYDDTHIPTPAEIKRASHYPLIELEDDALFDWIYASPERFFASIHCGRALKLENKLRRLFLEKSREAKEQVAHLLCRAIEEEEEVIAEDYLLAGSMSLGASSSALDLFNRLAGKSEEERTLVDYDKVLFLLRSNVTWNREQKSMIAGCAKRVVAPLYAHYLQRGDAHIHYLNRCMVDMTLEVPHAFNRAAQIADLLADTCTEEDSWKTAFFNDLFKESVLATFKLSRIIRVKEEVIEGDALVVVQAFLQRIGLWWDSADSIPTAVRMARFFLAHFDVPKEAHPHTWRVHMKRGMYAKKKLILSYVPASTQFLKYVLLVNQYKDPPPGEEVTADKHPLTCLSLEDIGPWLLAYPHILVRDLERVATVEKNVIQKLHELFWPVKGKGERSYYICLMMQIFILTAKEEKSIWLHEIVRRYLTPHAMPDAEAKDLFPDFHPLRFLKNEQLLNYILENADNYLREFHELAPGDGDLIIRFEDALKENRERGDSLWREIRNSLWRRELLKDSPIKKSLEPYVED